MLRSLLRRLHAWPVRDDAESVTFALQWAGECADCAVRGAESETHMGIETDGACPGFGHPSAQTVIARIQRAKGWEHVYVEKRGAEYRVKKV